MHDIILSLGNLWFLLALLPSVFGRKQPARVTCFSTALMLALFAGVYADLGLWLGACAASLTALAWAAMGIKRDGEWPWRKRNNWTPL